MRAALLGVVLGSLLLPVTAAEVCRIPDDLPRPRVPHSKPNPLPVAGYQLVLSWSPHYCERRAESRAPHAGGGRGRELAVNRASWDDEFQCHDNHFTWVVHGLWPQAENTTGKDTSPRACRPSDRLPQDILRANLCTTPSVSLMQHEWSDHGTCLTDDPRQYFGAIRKLLQRFPLAAMQVTPGPTTVGAIRTAIARANPALLRPQHIGVRLDGRHLKEAYLCLDLKQAPTACSGRPPRDDLPVTVD
ncbi:hypothetical protein E4L96_18665 [Massilia arenosa]|uniref:Uncharacterized protein n=1 Tax=Zemynaea arenosa TaxID=2561931 RepID=A0A4Y9S172_9BURK|nr:hypothetical protein [Massilia arenosa]TFW14893.1 hypothetical protein E4L96_18665 [Massilia arenosa]